MQQNNDIPIKKINDFMFSLKDSIGSGFSSVVYRGKHAQKEYPAAIKAIQLKKITNQVQSQLLNNEIKVLRMCNHPNIIQIFQIYQTNNNVYIITQLCDYDLATQLTKNGSIPQSQALIVLKQLSQAFLHLSQLGVIHRDVKPSNILFQGKTPKIADFGFCDIVNKQKVKQFYNVGSPKYMSPQAYKKTLYSQKSDMWGLGLIYLQMLLNKLPFEGMEYDEMIKSIASGNVYSQLKVTGFSKMILSRMLSVDVQRRIDFLQLTKILSSKSELQAKSLVNIPPSINITVASNNIIPLSQNSQEKHYQKPQTQRIYNESKTKQRGISPHANQTNNTTSLRRNSNLVRNKQNQKYRLIPQVTQFPKIQSGSQKITLHPGNNQKHQIQQQKIKIQTLLKIIAILHSDPCVRLNSDKIRLLKLVYTMAQKQLKYQSQYQSQRSAQLSNLQIILSGYGYLNFQQVAIDDKYYQYICLNINQLPTTQTYPYINFWVINCLKVYYQQLNKNYKFQQIKYNQQAYSSFLILKRLLDFSSKLKLIKNYEDQCFQQSSLTINNYNRLLENIQKIKY